MESHNPPPFRTQRSRGHSFPSPIDVGPPNPPPLGPGTPPRVHPLWSSAFLLTHRPVFSFNTICNNPSPPLANIVLFRLSLLGLKTLLLGRGFHTFIKNVSFSSPTDVGSHIGCFQKITFELKSGLPDPFLQFSRFSFRCRLILLQHPQLKLLKTQSYFHLRYYKQVCIKGLRNSCRPCNTQHSAMASTE